MNYKQSLFFQPLALILWLWFILLSSAILYSVPTDPSDMTAEYYIKAWTIDDGLPQNSILSLIQTRDGYIWFGTELGLVRFNGVDFRVYNRWNLNELVKNRIVVLFEDKKSRLWVGTDGGGICSLQNGKWSLFRSESGLPNDYVRAIAEDEAGRIWIGTLQGLCVFNEVSLRFQAIKGEPGQSPVNQIFNDSRQNLWVAVDYGLKVKKKGESSFRRVTDQSVQILSEDQSGKIWMGNQSGLFFLSGW